MFGQKQNTAVINSTLNPVFDDLLIFNMKGLDKEEFEELVKVMVKDSDLLTRNDIIGSYSFDATYVYYQGDHELYETWVALIEVDVDDEGVQDTSSSPCRSSAPTTSSKYTATRAEAAAAAAKGTKTSAAWC